MLGREREPVDDDVEALAPHRIRQRCGVVDVGRQTGRLGRHGADGRRAPVRDGDVDALLDRAPGARGADDAGAAEEEDPWRGHAGAPDAVAARSSWTCASASSSTTRNPKRRSTCGVPLAALSTTLPRPSRGGRRRHPLGAWGHGREPRFTPQRGLVVAGGEWCELRQRDGAGLPGLVVGDEVDLVTPARCRHQGADGAQGGDERGERVRPGVPEGTRVVAPGGGAERVARLLQGAEPPHPPAVPARGAAASPRSRRGSPRRTGR